MYEAPYNLIDKQVTLLYHKLDLSRIEVFHDGALRGFLVPLDVLVNSRIKRTNYGAVMEAATSATGHEGTPPPNEQSRMGGQLFEERKETRHE